MPKPTTSTQGVSIVKKAIVNNTRHKDYTRVVELAEKYTAYVTGENVEKLLRQFVPRENDSLFKQRVAITTLTTPDIAHAIASPMYKLGRVTANKSLSWKDAQKTANNKMELAKVTDKFTGGRSVDKYIQIRQVDLDQQDPNSWIVVEFEEAIDPNKPAIKANPYPFEVASKNAIDFKFVNDIAQWLLVLNDTETRYTLYLTNDSITADLITKEELANYQLKEGEEIFYKDEKDKEKNIYIIAIHTHKAGILPAKRVGTIKDPVTQNRTCVSIMHPAVCYFEKAIKTISEFDLTNALHTFPKVFRYGNRCPGDMKQGIVCNEGKWEGSEDTKNCPICKGSGWTNQTTTAEEVIVAAPKDMKDMISLEVMMTYKTPPSELIEFQKKLGLYELKELAIKAVYNSNTFVAQSIAKTATEDMNDLESVYDALSPFADSWSEMWVHIQTLCATFRDLGTDFTAHHSFPKDLKMKPLGALFADLKAANDSGAPSYIKKSITHDIAKKVYVDQPNELLKIQIKEKFYPFNGKSESEINYILANGLKSKFDRVLYASFDQIFDEIEQEQTGTANFYDMEFKKQKQLVKAKVDEYILVLDEEEAAGAASAFGGGDTSATVGDSVSIVAGKELNPDHVGKTFTVNAISGNDVELKSEDGIIVKGYSTEDIA